MRLLVITQKIDADDPVLGFFQRWLAKLAEHFESVLAICLEEGRHELPDNVRVLSLGKSKGHRSTFANRISYAKRLLRHAWRERHGYDAVFVHMNQEYVLLAGFLWKALGKKIYLWRNHLKGGLSTRLAVALSETVFCTSPSSFTARFKKAVLMPAGIDTEYFHRDVAVERDKDSILCIGRVSPVKKIETILRGFAVARQVLTQTRLLVIGDAPAVDKGYLDELKALAADLKIEDAVKLLPAIANNQTVSYYNRCGVSVNATDSGSLDKTVIEAMACEEIVLVSNISFKSVIDRRCLFAEGDSRDLAAKLETIHGLGADERASIGRSLREYAVSCHSLQSLISALATRLNA